MMGDRIKEMRLAHNFSQVTLAKKLNVSKQSVSNWENGNIQPSIDMLVKIAKLFSVSTDYLLDLTHSYTVDTYGLDKDQLVLIQNMITYLQKLNSLTK